MMSNTAGKELKPTGKLNPMFGNVQGVSVSEQLINRDDSST